MKKLLLIIVILSLLGSVFSSCGFSTVETVESWNTTDKENIVDCTDSESDRDTIETAATISGLKDNHNLSISHLDELGTSKYDGNIVSVLTSSEKVFYPEDDADIFSKLLYSRNGIVEEALSVKLSIESANESRISEKIQADNKAGISSADILCLTTESIYPLMSTDNLLSLNFIDRTKIDSVTDGIFTIKNSVYGLSGAASVSIDSFYCIYFNKNILSENGMDADYLYNLVLSGNFNWDALISIAEMNSGLKISTPLSKNVLSDLIFKSIGEDYLTYEGNIPQICFSADSVINTKNIINGLENNNLSTSNYSSADELISDESLFIIHKLGAINKISSSSCNFGVLPIPSLDGTYSSYVGKVFTVFAIPKSASNPNMSADVILSLNSVTSDIIYREFVDYHLQNSFGDEKSADMLDLILNSYYSDLAYVIGPSKDEVKNATYMFVQNCLSYDNDSIGDKMNKLSENLKKAFEEKKETDKKKK